ncbi:MAG: DUF4293 family protein [Bacteroidales bacterium]|nr:DUF4293 family protein [Bacteroidales bacterium]
MAWRRFQTLLLVIVAGLLLTHFWVDFCYTMVNEEGASEPVKYSIRFVDRSQFLIFTLTTFMIAVTTIAYSKARLMQIRLCIMNMLLLLGYQIWIVVEFFKLKQAFTFTIASLFPFACIVLLLLAVRYIWRDEATAIAAGILVKNKKKEK